RVLARGWVSYSTRAHASIHEDGDYGLGWWRKSFEIDGAPVAAYYASGNGGQLMFIVPERSLVVLFHGGNYGNFGTWRQFRDDYLPRIIRAAR
ncbi:MAG: 6-aminohexanoate hydrolase, partial [Myxococcota bacterium]